MFSRLAGRGRRSVELRMGAVRRRLQHWVSVVSSKGHLPDSEAVSSIGSSTTESSPESAPVPMNGTAKRVVNALVDQLRGGGGEFK